MGCYGDGGALFTDNDEWAALMEPIRVHGKGSMKYDNVRIGLNSRLDTIQVAILSVKLKAFRDYELDAVNKAADKYTQLLKDIVKTPVVPDKFYSSWVQYTLRLESKQQRVKNQQAVITGIINKCTGSTSILTNYTGILNSVEDNIQTNMTQKDITSLVKMQLGDMSGWTIKQCSLTGTGKSTPVYSIPNYSVYVMVPDQSSIDNAKSQIAAVMAE